MEHHSSSSGEEASDPKINHAGSSEPGCVSMQRSWSLDNPPKKRRRKLNQGRGEPSCVSMRSDCSMGIPPVFSNEGVEPSCVSMKSDCSMGIPPVFSNERGEPSCVSMKSECSMGIPPVFSKEGEPSCVSMKTECSMGIPPVFSTGKGQPSCASMKSDQSMEMYRHEQKVTEAAVDTQNLVVETVDLDSYPSVDNKRLRVLERLKTSMKNKYECLFEGLKTEEHKTFLNRIYTQLYIIEGESEGVNEEHEILQVEKTCRKHLQETSIKCLDIFKSLCYSKERTEKNKRSLKVSPESLRKKEIKDDVQTIRSVLTKGIAGIGKTVSVQKFILDWAEGKANQDVDFIFVLPFRELNLIKDDQYSLHALLCAFHPELKSLDPKIYAELKAVFIFDGLDESRIPLNFERKVSDITKTSTVGELVTNLINGELFPSALIWITSRPAAANQIPPQYINRVTEIQGFNNPQKEEYFRKRISDEDQARRIISHIKTVRSLHIMCYIPIFCWISATVFQRITEQQTEIPKTLTEMYSHFLLTQMKMKNEKYEEKEERNPNDLLESNRTMFLKLAELAFKQLMKGNVMFYEEDVREIGIDVTEASVYSGIFTEIFREECVLYQKKVYCFVHLSFQEFLAAVYVFHCYENKNMEELQSFKRKLSENSTLKPQERSKAMCGFRQSCREWSDNVPQSISELHSEQFVNATLDELLMGAVDKAVESPNGQLDLFLRFLLGISLKSNQRLLQGLLKHRHCSSKRTVEHIKDLIKRGNLISMERAINLFLCLSEMYDQSLLREVQEYLKSEQLSPGQCSGVACMILTSEEVLDELDLKKYNTSEEGYMRLIPVLSICRKALLVGCNLTSNSCETLSSVLQSVNCPLKELDLSNNDLQDSGVELLSAGLKSSHCKVETLRLAICNLGVKACENLGSALQSTNSCLKELDLSNNDLRDSGVELLSAGLRSLHCKLETLRLSGCMVTDEGCSFLASALISNPSRLKELDVTYNHPGEPGGKLLSEKLKDPHCTLENLQVMFGGEIWMKPGLKKYACTLTLDPNTAHTCLSLSEGNRKVEWTREDQPYPDHPDRFEVFKQVLSVESLSGRCYWEAECSGSGSLCVSYRGIQRKGDSDECLFGFNNQSWSLEFTGDRFSLRHNKQETEMYYSTSGVNKVGVYLDWMAGTLSFYSVSPNTHTPNHLHTLHTTFTEPLYAGFGVWGDSSVSLCET